MKVAFYTLGCKVNSYETSAIECLFNQAGYERVEFTDLADVYVVNTCTVTNQSDVKSRKKIRQAIQQNPDAIIVAMGCYSQMNADSVSKIVGVDIVLGNNEKSRIIEKIDEYRESKKQLVCVKSLLKGTSFEALSAVSFDHTRAYLKIQDGCNNFCSYCIIPFARGNLRSRPVNECLDEVKKIIANGYKEIVLTGIHTGAYGHDLEKTDFTQLLKQILAIPGLERLRISSMEITEITDEFLKLFSSEKLARHLHLPLQSGTDSVLHRMNRKYSTDDYRRIIKKIRQAVPDIAITTDLIVGFPGETEDDFQATYDFLNDIEFFMIHVFPYSPRVGTNATKMPNQVPKDISSKRVLKVRELNEKLMLKYAEKFVGKKLSFIPETFENGFVIGHTDNYLLMKLPGTNDMIGKLLEITFSIAKIPQNIGFF